MLINKTTFEFLKNTIGIQDPSIEIYCKPECEHEHGNITMELFCDTNLPLVFAAYAAQSNTPANEWRFIEMRTMALKTTKVVQYYLRPYETLILVEETKDRTRVTPEEFFYDENGDLKNIFYADGELVIQNRSNDKYIDSFVD